MELATGTDMQSGWETQLLTSEAIVHYWDDIKTMLEKVPQTWRLHTIESFYMGALEGRIQVWSVGTKTEVKAVLFTQLALYPAHRVLQGIWMCGEGALEGLDILDGVATRFARIQGCDEIQIHGRRGWKPLVSKLGYVEDYTVFTKSVPKDVLQ